MGARVLDESGKEVPIVMGSYGIGIERILAGAVELHHDGDGIRMPMSIAPLHVALLPLQMQDGAVRDAAEKLYAELTAAGVEVLLDDRDERAGVKFKDADLIGIPLRVALGKKGLNDAGGAKGEWKPRGAKEVQLVPLGEIAFKAADAVRGGAARAAAGDGGGLAGAAEPGRPARRRRAVAVLPGLDEAGLQASGRRGPARGAAVRLAKLGIDAGADGAVCSPLEVQS